MKTFLKIAVLSAFLLMLAGLMTSCNEKQDECNPIPLNLEDCWVILENFEPDSSASIIGKWKLFKFLSGLNGCSDHSLCDVIYEFKPDGTLIISEAGRLVRTRSFSPVDIEDGTLYQLHFGNVRTRVLISRDKMKTIGSTTIDGAILNYGMFVFIRITPNIN